MDGRQRRPRAGSGPLRLAPLLLAAALIAPPVEAAPRLTEAQARAFAKNQEAAWNARDLDAYFLGPKPFMAQVKRHLQALGVPAEQSRYEFFGPASALDS